MGKDTSKQKMAWVQMCWAASGCGLFAAAMLAFTESDLVRISGWLGLAMLAAGCVNIFIATKNAGSSAAHTGFWLTGCARHCSPYSRFSTR